MKLINSFHKPVYWRTFNETDTTLGGGLHDGILQPSKSVKLRENTPTGQFQLELKKEGLLGQFIINASRNNLYRDDDSVMEVGADGIATFTAAVVPDLPPGPSAVCAELQRQLEELQQDLQTSTNKEHVRKQMEVLEAQMHDAGC